MNIGTLKVSALTTVSALEEIRSYTQRAIDRSNAVVLFVKVHGFFEANHAVNRISVQVDAEGGVGDEGHAYTSYSLAEIAIEVESGVEQHYAYGFDDIEYHDSGQIKVEAMEDITERLTGERLVEAIRNRLEGYDRNTEWLTDNLPYAVGNPGGRDVVLEVERTQVNSVADVLLHRLRDDSGRLVEPTQQEIQDAQDEVIDWVDYI